VRLSFSGLGLITLVVSGFFIWSLDAHFSSGPMKSDSTIIIPVGVGLSEITEILTEKGILDQPLVFKLAAKLSGKSKTLHAGEYFLKAHSSQDEVLEMLFKGDIVLRKITIPEGLTSLQIVKKLNLIEGLIGKISQRPLEGTLLPETYKYIFGDTRESIVIRMRQEMAAFVQKEWEKRHLNLPFKSMEEAIILASIIEKETGLASERRLVASVFINRLNEKMKLQSDPTVRYGVPSLSNKKRLTHRDLKRQTRYNTYKIPGLPPTPICNPGKASIIAALTPANTNFFYFVANGTGGHFFSKTLKEHNKYVARWRKIKKRP